MQLSPTEFTARYATTVATLADAWAFVMSHVDKAGSAPQIQISPFWRYSNDEDPMQGFEVSVSGMVHAK